MLYRGLADKTWDAEASLHRRLRGKSNSAPKEEFIRASEELVRQAKLRGYARDPAGKLEDLQIMGRLQHYGAATCLIDFTRNPLVALWFACQPPNQKGDSTDGKVIAVDSGSPAKYQTVQLKDLGKTLEEFMKAENLWKWRPEKLDSRVIAQHSEFVFGRPVAWADGDIVIPAAFKADILRELAKNDISEEHLFSDFYGFVQINAHDRPYYRKSADNYAFLAAQAAQADDYQGAIDWYGVAIMKNSGNPDWFNNRGNAKYALNDYKGAIADYDRAIEINPQFANAYNNRGNAKYALSDYQSAIADYDRAIEINPQFANAYYNRGNAKDELNDYKGAIADYDRTIKITPQDANAYNNRGNAKYALNDYKGAIADYDRAIEINPQYANAYYNRGNVKYQLNDYKGAIADHDRAIEINPQYADAYNNRGNAKDELGNHEGMMADYGQAIELNPQYAGAHYNRAIAKRKSGDLPGAIADYDRAIEINPQFAKAYYGRGVAKEISGDKDGAYSDFQQAWKLDPSLKPPKKK